jgi:hypothetical protein
MDYYGRGPTLRDGGPHGNPTVDWLSPQLWVMVASNGSVGLAFYGLMSFYHAVRARWGCECLGCTPGPCLFVLFRRPFLNFFSLGAPSLLTPPNARFVLLCTVLF